MIACGLLRIELDFMFNRAIDLANKRFSLVHNKRLTKMQARLMILYSAVAVLELLA